MPSEAQVMRIPALALPLFVAIAALAFSVRVANAQDDVQQIRQAAEQGDPKAQTRLGTMFANGSGVPQDDAKAIEWYRKAADQGFAEAQVSLGMMYDSGNGVRQDPAQAVAWYRKAADQGLDRGDTQGNEKNPLHVPTFRFGAGLSVVTRW